MGQIVGGSAKTKRCNIRQLSQLGTPAAGEHILVSSDNSMNAAGQGNFDCYIEGNGTDAATALELKPLADVTPTKNSKNSVTSGGVYDSIEGVVYYNNGGGGDSGRLPDGYKELEWIASSGMQTIDTQVSADGTWNFNAQATATGNATQLLINKNINGGHWFGAINSNVWGCTTNAGGFTSIPSTTKATCEVTFGSSQISGTANGESFSRARSSASGNYYLFASSDGQYPISAKLWEITLMDGDTLLFDGVPCRNPNNKVGLYDLVNNRFLTNSGSRNLIGSDE